MTPKQILIKARALIDTPKKWHKGNKVHGQHCAIEAIDLACRYGEDVDFYEMRRNFMSSAGIPESGNVSSWNDDENIKHSDVMNAFDKAIASLPD